MGPTNIKFVGTPCGQHGPYTFYKAFKYTCAKKTKILSLGEFFYVKIFKEVEVCIGELQLLWEDRYNPGQFLCMVRLYFLPEQTPDGRKNYNGEDEVLMESDKVPFLLEDLISLLSDTMEWTAGRTPHRHTLPPLSHKATRMLSVFASNNRGLDMNDVQRERKQIGESACSASVVIVNFPQYCRYRAVLKRLEGCEQHWLRSLLVGALGGITNVTADTRVLFCRDSFEHPVIQEHELRQDHLAPNLRGRPKKKRAHFRKYEKDHVYSNESDDDSNDSLASSVGSGSKASPVKVKVIKEKVRLGRPPNGTSNINAGLRSSTAANKKALKRKKKKRRGGAEEDVDEIDDVKIDISPLKPSHKPVVNKQEERFLKRLALFIRERNIAITRLPKLGFKEVDLFEFYNMTLKLGGYEQVTRRKLWKQIYDALGGNPSNTSAATCTRKHYEKMLMQYELHMKGIEAPVTQTSSTKGSKKRKTASVEQLNADQDSASRDSAKDKDSKEKKASKKEEKNKKKIKDMVKNESEKENQNILKEDKEAVSEDIKVSNELDTSIKSVVEIKAEQKPDMKSENNVLDEQTPQNTTPQKLNNMLEQFKQVPTFQRVPSIDANQTNIPASSSCSTMPMVTPQTSIPGQSNIALSTNNQNANGLINSAISVPNSLSGSIVRNNIQTNAQLSSNNSEPLMGIRPPQTVTSQLQAQLRLNNLGVMAPGASGPRQPAPAHTNKPSSLISISGLPGANAPGTRLLLVTPPVSQAAQNPSQMVRQLASQLSKNPSSLGQVQFRPQSGIISKAHLPKNSSSLLNINANKQQTNVILPAHFLNQSTQSTLPQRNLPAGHVGHDITPRTKKKRGFKFLNPPPKCYHQFMLNDAYFDSPSKEDLFIPQSQRKRNKPYGAGFYKEMNLTTPPPAHCKPVGPEPKKRRRTNSPANINNTNTAPIPPKRPKLQIPAQPVAHPSTSAPPRNPFVGGVTLDQNILPGFSAQGLGSAQLKRAVMQHLVAGRPLSAHNVIRPAVVTSQPLVAPAAHQKHTSLNAKLPIDLQRQLLNAMTAPVARPTQLQVNTQGNAQAQDAPLDLSAKPQNTMYRQLNKPSSPIVISPHSNDEPMDLCMKKKPTSGGNLSNTFTNFKANTAINNTQFNKAASAIPTPQYSVLTSPLLHYQNAAQSNMGSRGLRSPNSSVIQTVPPSPVMYPVSSTVLQALASNSLLQASASLLPKTTSVLMANRTASALQQNLNQLGQNTVMDIPTPNPQAVNASASLLPGSILSAALASQASVSPSSAAAALLQQRTPVIQASPNIPTPMLSLASVIRPPASSTDARFSPQSQNAMLSSAMAMLHPAFLNASSLSNAVTQPVSSSTQLATPTIAQVGQAGQSLVLPQQLTPSNNCGTSMLIPVPVQQPQASQILTSPLTATQTSTAS